MGDIARRLGAELTLNPRIGPRVNRKIEIWIEAEAPNPFLAGGFFDQAKLLKIPIPCRSGSIRKPAKFEDTPERLETAARQSRRANSASAGSWWRRILVY